jgi:uncharacterized surface anchored protein
MRARDQESTNQASRGHAQPRRAGVRLNRAGWWVHLTGAIALLLGLLLPIATTDALAAPGDMGPLPATTAQQAVPAGVTQVIAFGDFQSQLGCGDWDPSCGASALSNNGGIWSGSFPLAPGSYAVQFAVNDQNGNQLVFGGPDGFGVNEGQAGAFFLYDSHTNQVQAQAVDALYSVQTDLGTFVPTPAGGTLDILVQSQGGATNVQLVANGEAVGGPQQASLSPGWTRISLDTSGNVVNSQGLPYGTLTIQRLDQNGAPAGGGCYQLYGNGLVNQACADGSGTATMTFPNGLTPGAYTLSEVQAPAGQESLPDQPVDLQSGDSVVQLQPAGSNEELPGDDGNDDGVSDDDDDGVGDDGLGDDGDDQTDANGGILDDDTRNGQDETANQDGFPSAMVVTLQDQDGIPIGSACWQLVQDGNVVQESCDRAEFGDTNPDNGRTAFDSVPPGEYTLRQSDGPQDVPLAPDEQVTVTGDGAQLDEVVQVDVQPATEPQVETGDVVVLRQDAQGNPVGGACFVIQDDAGNAITQQVCDEDGDVADDGRTGFFAVPAGTWWVEETRTPDGYEPATAIQVTVNPGSTVDVTLQGAAITAPTEEPTEAAPTEEPTEQPTDPVATETPTGEPTGTGSLQVDLYDPDNNLVGGACWELIQNGNVVKQSCDTDDGIDRFPFNGKVGMYEIPAGTYTLRMSQVPDGFEAVPDAEVEITTADDLRNVTIQPLGEPTPQPTEGPATEQPTEEPTTEVPTAEPTEAVATETPTEQPAGPGDLVVTLQDDDGNPIGGACFELVNDSDTVVATSCDTPDRDQNPNNGRTGFYGVPAGTYELRQQGTLESFEPVSQDDVVVEPNQQTDVTLTAQSNAEPTEEPTEQAATEEPTEQPTTEPGETTGVFISLDGVETDDEQVCVALNTTGGIGMRNPPAGCNNDPADLDPREDSILLADVPPGTYAFSVTSGPEDLVETDWPNVTVEEGQVTDVFLAPQEPDTGGLQVNVVDQSGAAVTEEGTCITVVGVTSSICDNQGSDGAPDAGVIAVDDLPPGTYDLAVDSVPAGFQPGEGLSGVTVESGQVTEVDLTLAIETGSIQVIATDANGNPIGGACWALLDGDTEVAAQCDDDTNGGIANDGFATFTSVPPGNYTLAETQAPDGFLPVDDRQVTIVAGENAPVSVPHQPRTGSMQATILANGSSVAGTCLTIGDLAPVCDNGAGDEDPAAGIILVSNLPVGEYPALLTAVPDAYQAPDTQTVTVVADEVAPVTFDLQPANGTVRAVVTGSDGQLGGTCLELVNLLTVCDNDAEDADPAIGIIQVEGVAPGTYDAILSTYPEGYGVPAEQQANVAAGATTDLTFTLELLPPETGNLRILVQTGDAEPVAGGCVVLAQNDQVVVGPVCDNGQGDGDAADGTIQFGEVATGSYAASLTADSTATIPGFQSADSPSITVAANEDNQGVITVVLNDEPATGSLELITRNNATNQRLSGACYALSGPADLTACDNDSSDLNAQEGVIQLDELPAGDYDLTMSTTPAGFATASGRTVTVEGGANSSYEIRLDQLPQPSTLTVLKVDPGDEPLGNSCFTLRQGTTTISTRCDATDSNPNDGVLTFENVPAGSYMLVETRAPSPSWNVSSPISVTMVAGIDQEVRVVNYPKPGRLVVTKVDANDATLVLEGACFELRGDRTYGPYCDGDDGVNDGRITFPNVVPGTYTLIETSPPPGYQAASDREVTINAGSTRNVSVENRATPPAQTGSLVVTKVDGDGNRLAGACFRLFDGNRAVTLQVCDAADGASDGRITFANVPLGTWTLRETVTPSTDYQYAEQQDVRIRLNETTRVTVENELKPGRLQVNKTNTDGRVLQEACFDLREDTGGARCTDAYGVVVFSGLEPGRYTLVETQAPFGYQKTADVTNIEVRPGQTKVVNVVDQRTPPPANTGSVQVQKFYCPTDGESRTAFFGGAQGSAELSRTAGCERGNAVFTLVGDNGTGGPGSFQTGSNGQYQVTVTEGIYRLTETDPQYGESQSTVRVRVNRGQMTTVIVINYVAPPEPEPIEIDVAKFTCAPSFNGTRYEDFMEGCTGEQQLTNDITVRLEGPVTGRAVTGGTGERGRVSFTDLVPGTYTISEDRPLTIPTDYLFCGLASNAVDQMKAVNGSLTVTLDYGDTLTCTFHNIPEVLTPDSGTILVRKFVCEVKSPPKGYDFEEECGLSHQNASFSLAKYNAEMQTYGEPVVVQANPDGFARWTHLSPGSYKLVEVDGTWCHAESNSVNAQGDVVVQANKLSEVWIYNCVEPQTPPNTGSGDAATNPPPATLPADGTGPVELPAISPPILAAGAWLENRRRAA